MKLRDIYAQVQGRPVISFEFFPPKTPKGEESLFEELPRLKALGPSFFSMTYGAGGSTRDKTVELGGRIRAASGVETVCHLTCVGQSKDEVRGVLRQIQAGGMENVMALRGDPPRGQTDWRPHPDGFHYAAELVAEIRAMGNFSVAVAGFPETHPDAESPEKDLDFLARKIETGADAVVTQLFYDNEAFFAFDKKLKARGVKIPIVPGILPMLSVGQIRRFTDLCKSKIPGELESRLAGVEADDDAARELGIEFAAKQIKALLDYGAPGVHIYCLNKAYSAESILERLGLAGWANRSRGI